MARRHPLLTFIVIVVGIFGIYTFLHSFESSSTLTRIQRVVPYKSDSGYTHEEKLKEKELADAYLSKEHDYSRKNDDITESDYISANKELLEHPPKAEPKGSPKESKDTKESTKEDTKEPLSHREQKHKDTPQEMSIQTSPNDFTIGLPIMQKMPNQTARAEVGNAGWKLIHTILAQFPEEPTLEDKETLKSFFRILSRVYPCQECAYHFQDLIQQFPPQLSSRKTAVLWGCDAHNKVNKRLGKEVFDCANIFEKYDCGCGDQVGEDEESDEAVRRKIQGSVGSKKEGSKESTKGSKESKGSTKEKESTKESKNSKGTEKVKDTTDTTGTKHSTAEEERLAEEKLSEKVDESRAEEEALLRAEKESS